MDATGLASAAATANPYGAAIGVGMGVLKTGYGIAQSIKANKLAKANIRPTYSIPTEIEQNLNDAQRMALEGLPDEQKQQFINNVQRSQQFGLQQASSRKAGLAGLSATVQSGNDAYNQLLSQDAGARLRNEQALMSIRGQMAAAKNTAFDINQMQPYQDRANAATALKGAGLQNIYGGLSDASQGALRMPGLGGGGDNSSATGGFTLNPNTMGGLKQPNWGLG